MVAGRLKNGDYMHEWMNEWSHDERMKNEYACMNERIHECTNGPWEWRLVEWLNARTQHERIHNEWLHHESTNQTFDQPMEAVMRFILHERQGPPSGIHLQTSYAIFELNEHIWWVNWMIWKVEIESNSRSFFEGSLPPSLKNCPISDCAAGDVSEPHPKFDAAIHL